MLKQYEERLRSVYTSLGNNFYQVDEQTLALFRVNLTKNVVEETKGRDLFASDSARPPYAEILARRAVNHPIAAERERMLRTFDRERLSALYLEGRVTASEVLYSRRRDWRDCFVELSATLTRHPLTGDMIAFITERECNVEKVRETLMTKILARQFDMVAYLVNGSYGVSIGDAARITKGSIFPATRFGEYQQYLDNQVLPVLSGPPEYRAAAMEALSLDMIEAQTRIREPYIVNIAIEIDGEVFHKRFDFYLVDLEARFYIVLKSDTTELHREQAARNDQLRRALEDRYGIKHSLLHVEPTESMYSDNPGRIERTLERLHENGFSIELDDFGSGYSSLTSLNTPTLDVMKIDMSLIRQAAAGNYSIPRFASLLADNLRLKTVVEGVETAEQVAALKVLGCDYIQGYYFSKPLPAKEFEEYLVSHNRQVVRV